jgi:tRNA-2-methylthio-N6-dimethylallyladenosine synthase
MNKYHIITIGCQMNKSDSERLAGRLEKMGYKRSDNKYQADLVVVNTCGVRQSAEDRVYGIIPKIKKQNPKAKIILTGCLVNREDVKRRLKNYVDVWLPINKFFNFQFSIFKQFFNFQFSNKNQKKKLSCDNDGYLKIQPIYTSKFSAFVPIGNGCNNFCSYCVVPDARGEEVYRPVKDILDEVKSLVKKDYKEIILIAQNVNSYKSYNVERIMRNAKRINFAKLLKMVNDIPGDFWIRFITSHPKDMSDKLIKTIARCPKVCQHIHLPAQAGDDKVLKAMNRKYSTKHYANLIKKIRQAMPDSSITTDIIVGFPGETKKQFNNTVKLFRQVKFDMAYIAKYSLRPGTAAAKLDDDVPQQEKKRREEELMKILRLTALANNKKYIGKTVKVLVEGKNKRSELFGSTETAKTVKISAVDFNQRLLRPPQMRGPRNDKLIGKFVNVKINKVRDFGLEGEIFK